MIVWTPNAEAAAGGRAAMESLALASVANANLVYANSGINAQLNLVYAAPVSLHRDARVDRHRLDRHPRSPATASWTRSTRCALSTAPTW